MDSEPSFLGTGWSFPPSFTRGGSDVAMVSGTEDIHQSLSILLSTQPGERILQDNFGCDLNGILFEEMGQGLVNTISGLISDAVLYHESRIRLDGIDVRESGTEQGLLLIRIDYTVPATNSRFNMVYPFHINEASMPGRT